MARQIIFHKYQGTENGFLIYDIRKNGGEMNDGLLHMIRSRNFGLDLERMKSYIDILFPAI